MVIILVTLNSSGITSNYSEIFLSLSRYRWGIYCLVFLVGDLQMIKNVAHMPEKSKGKGIISQQLLVIVEAP